MQKCLNYSMRILCCLSFFLTQATFTGQAQKANEEQQTTDKVTNPEWEALNKKVSKYQQEGKYEEALPYAKEALSMAKKELGTDHPDYATSLNNLFELHYYMGQYEESLNYAKQALTVAKKTLGEDHLDYAKSLNNLADIHLFMGQYKDAESLYVKARNIFKALGKDHRDYAENLNNLAVLYSKMGRYEEAELLHIEARDIRKIALGEDHPLYAMSLNNLATLCSKMGRYEEAEPLFIEAKNIFKALGKDHRDYALSLNNLATLYQNMGRYEEAQPLFIEARDIRKIALSKDHPDYAQSLNNLALLYHKMGRYGEAEPLFIEARNIFKALGEDHPNYTASLNNLALLYHKMGRYEEAEPLYIKVRGIRKIALGEDHPHYALSLHNLAFLYKMMARYEEALPLYIEARNIRKIALREDHPRYAQSLNNLATLYHKMGRYEEAEPLFIEARNIQKTALGEDHPHYAQSLNNLAFLYYDMGRYEEAEPLFIEAKGIRKIALGEDHPHYAQSLHNLTALYYNAGQYEKAEPLAIEALSINSKFLDHQYRSLGEKQQEQLLSITHNRFKRFYSFAANAKNNDSLALHLQNAHLSIKGLSLRSSQNLQKIVQQSTDEELNKLYNQWQGRKRRLAKSYTLSIKERETKGIDLGAWEKQANELERQLVIKSKPLAEQFNIQNTKVQFGDIKEQLTQNTVAIDFVHFDYHNDFIWTDTVLYYALVTRKDSKYPAYIRLGTAKEIVALLGQKVAMNSNNYINDIRKSHELYQYLWKPLEPYLRGVNTIHLSPEGLLSKVAFETLVSNRASEERLMDQYQFRYYGTLKDFVLQARGIGQTSPVKNKKAVLLGGALYDLDKTTLEQLGESYQGEQSRTSGIGVTPDSAEVSEFNYLAGSQKEVEELTSVLKKSGWDVDLLVGKGALEDKIKAIKGNDKPRILHLATHGYFFPKPEEEKQERILMSEDNIFQQRIQQHWRPLYRSGLALSGANHTWMGRTPPVNAEDGILTAYEVAMLDLYGTELVVLSACETGLGESSDTEGIYGLQRAFKQAGANKLIVSLWQVPDQQTQELMGYFYKNYLSGKSINESLETAKAAMRKIYSNPYYWAAFILVE